MRVHRVGEVAEPPVAGRRGPARRARRRRSAGRRVWPCRAPRAARAPSRRSVSVRLPAPSRPSITTSRPTDADTVSPGTAGGGRRSPPVDRARERSGVGQPPAVRVPTAAHALRAWSNTTCSPCSGSQDTSPSKLHLARRRLVRGPEAGRDPRGPRQLDVLPDVVAVRQRVHAQVVVAARPRPGRGSSAHRCGVTVSSRSAPPARTARERRRRTAPAPAPWDGPARVSARSSNPATCSVTALRRSVGIGASWHGQINRSPAPSPTSPRNPGAAAGRTSARRSPSRPPATRP